VVCESVEQPPLDVIDLQEEAEEDAMILMKRAGKKEENKT